MDAKLEDTLAKNGINAHECYTLTEVIHTGGEGAADAKAKMDALPEGVIVPEAIAMIYRRIKGKAAGLYRMGVHGEKSTDEYIALEESLRNDLQLLDGSSVSPVVRRSSSQRLTEVVADMRGKYMKHGGSQILPPSNP